jgi:GT2 family glycosyltransferase/glycosyltransferase involved in cell wall biosynthesis
VLDLSRAHTSARAAWDTGEALEAAGDLRGALAWMGRAHRMAPTDQNLCFALACLRLRADDPAGAAELFAAMARRFDVRECWTGLAASSLRTGQLDEARRAAGWALSAHATDSALAKVAGEVVRAAGLPGWCGVRGDGTLLTWPDGLVRSVALDGGVVSVPGQAGAARLPRAWRRASQLTVMAGDAPLLGSPVSLDAIRRVQGFVERTAAGIEGWAWSPSDPERDPPLRVVIRCGDGAARARGLVARDLVPVTGEAPLARRRGFALAVPDGCEVDVLGADGRHLLGSPLLPPRAAPVGATAASFTMEPDLPADVVVPVYRGLRTTLDCLATVLATVRAPDRIVVVDDASPEPALVAALDRLAAEGRIVLLRPAAGPGPHRGGFPGAANAGLRHAAGRHAVLLNSDTLVAPGWLATLRAAACSAADIGTATPLSNEASVFSTPDPGGGNPAPDAAGTARLAALAARANAGRLVDVPTAHGFCMFIRRDCLEATGLLDAVAFAQGYGEENDFCERARALGYRHVAVPAVYVAHRGGASFGGAGGDLLRRNLALLDARYPTYRARVAAFVASDALFPARRRLDAARWRARAGAEDAVLLVTHGGGGGTARIVAERAADLRARGLRAVVLRARDGLCEVGDAEGDTPNLAYALPAELGRLGRLLAGCRPVRAELHHLLGHDHSVLRLLARLGVPTEMWVHDYAWFCARLSFVTGEGRFCGEAPPSVCETCLATWGRGIDDPIGPAALRARSAADLRAAQLVVVPSEDVARRVARHAPGAAVEIRAWEAAPPFQAPACLPGWGRRRVAVVGAIGLEKGFEVLLACARDAAERDLALEFVVVGYTVDDTALLATGRAFVTGEFARAEAATLIAAQGAQLAFLPSVWPETWCYALSDAWAAGLSAAVFAIGTPADRVRAQGRGWVLPLGLPADRVNEVLLSL